MLVAVTGPLVGRKVGFHPWGMVWPAGRVKARDQPLIAELPVLVIAMVAVSPVFQALIVSVTRQLPEPGGAELGVVVGVLVGGVLVGGVLVPASRPRNEIAYASCPVCGR